MVGGIIGVNDSVNLVCPGEAIRRVQLVHTPPRSKPAKPHPQPKHQHHAGAENCYPVNPSFWWRLLMDNDASVPLLDDLVASGIDIPPGAGWQTSLFLGIVQRVSQVERVVWVVLPRHIGSVFGVNAWSMPHSMGTSRVIHRHTGSWWDTTSSVQMPLPATRSAASAGVISPSATEAATWEMASWSSLQGQVSS